MTQLKPGQNTTWNIRRADIDGQTGDLLLVVLISLFTEHVSLVFPGHRELDRALPVGEGRAYLRFLIDEAAAGTPLWQIVERAGAWSTAAAAVNEAAMDLPEPTTLDAYRQAAPKTGTEANVHTRRLTPAELDRVRNHHDGLVTLLPGQPWTLLRAIARRGYGDPVYGTRRKVVAVRLNQRGLELAGTNEGIAA